MTHTQNTHSHSQVVVSCICIHKHVCACVHVSVHGKHTHTHAHQHTHTPGSKSSSGTATYFQALLIITSWHPHSSCTHRASLHHSLVECLQAKGRIHCERVMHNFTLHATVYRHRRHFHVPQLWRAIQYSLNTCLLPNPTPWWGQWSSVCQLLFQVLSLWHW